jgi:hypothetical protein
MSAGFKINSSPIDSGAKSLPISSLAVAINDLLELLVGATTWTKCTSSSNYFSRKAIALAATTTAATEVLAYELNGEETVEAESINNSDATHNGDRMVLTDENTVNNTGTDNTSQNVCFMQTGVVGAAADKRILGRVLVGNGVDPDAA